MPELFVQRPEDPDMTLEERDLLPSRENATDIANMTVDKVAEKHYTDLDNACMFHFNYVFLRCHSISC